MGESKASIEARKTFNIARSLALNSYTNLEAGVALLFASTLGTKLPYATFIISKIINARARNEVVQRIVDAHTVKLFKLFTNSLFAEIGAVDHLRNQLVHWRVDQCDDGAFVLKPADILSDSPATMGKAEMDALTHKCLFLMSVMNEFVRFLVDRARDPALRKRFSQPLCYPPEPDDLLFRFHRGSGAKAAG